MSSAQLWILSYIFHSHQLISDLFSDILIKLLQSVSDEKFQNAIINLILELLNINDRITVQQSTCINLLVRLFPSVNINNQIKIISKFDISKDLVSTYTVLDVNKMIELY